MRNLITIDDYKLYATISSDTLDDKLELILKSVSELVKNYCGRNFIDGYNVATSEFIDLTEYYTGGDTTFYTREFPLITISSLSLSTDNGQTYTALAEYTDFVLDKQNDSIKIFSAESVNSPNAYKIIYKGGYSSTPTDLQIACLDLVEYYMKKESTPRKTSGSVSIEYIRTNDFPAHIKRVLDLYRLLK